MSEQACRKCGAEVGSCWQCGEPIPDLRKALERAIGLLDRYARDAEQFGLSQTAKAVRTIAADYRKLVGQS
jgi:hypothetical protein